MSISVIPFRDPSAPLPFKKRIAARKAYREGMATLAQRAVEDAFVASARLLGADGILLEDAMSLFVAAMRRELRRTGTF